MCLAIPMKIKSIEADTANVSACGLNQNISLVFVPEARVGNYVLVHAGFAIKQIDEEEAEKTISLLNEIAANERNMSK